MKLLVVLVENEKADAVARAARDAGALGVGATPDIGDGEDGGPSGQAMDEMLTQAFLDAAAR